MTDDQCRVNIIQRGSTKVPSSYAEIKKMYIRPDPPKSFIEELNDCLEPLLWGSGGTPGCCQIGCGCCIVFGVLSCIH